jgi:hypothetical protein
MGDGESILTVDDLLAEHTPEVQDLANRLRTLVRETCPDAEEKVQPGWGNITYAQQGIFAAVSPSKAHASLYFWDGTGLDDPRDLLLGSGKKLRRISVRSTDDIDAEYFAGLLRQALSRHMTPKSGSA